MKLRYPQGLRTGTTLVELLAVLAISGMLLAASTSAMAILFQAQRGFHRNLDHQRAVQRFADRLRNDAHNASSAQILQTDTIAQIVELQFEADETVRYAHTESGIEREVHRDETIVHRDLFRLPAAEIEMSLSQDSATRIVINVQTREAKISDPRRIEVAIGRPE